MQKQRWIAVLYRLSGGQFIKRLYVLTNPVPWFHLHQPPPLVHGSGHSQPDFTFQRLTSRMSSCRVKNAQALDSGTSRKN